MTTSGNASTGDGLLAASSTAVHGACRPYHTWRVTADDVKRFEEELKKNADEAEAAKDAEAVEVTLTERTRYVGPEEEAAAAAAAEAATNKPPGDDAAQPTADAAASTADATAAAAAAASPSADAEGATAAAAAATSDAAADPGAEPIPPLEDLLAANESVAQTTEIQDAEFLYGGLTDAEARRKREDAVRRMYEGFGAGEVAVAKGRMRFTEPNDEFAIAMQRAAAGNRQKGPYVDSKTAELERFDVDDRRRRAVDRVPQMESQYEANETSFRRLPRGFRLPDEYFIRHMYPMMTKLQIDWAIADCVDGDARDIYEQNPGGIKYGTLYPPNYDETRTYPVMVVLSDARGTEYDVEDLCANFFERDEIMRGLVEQEWLVVMPCINTKHSQALPTEAVVARFCDWVSARFKCEHGRPHLFGRGLGGYLSLRTCTYHRQIVLSCTSIIGRLAAPFRPLERPQTLIKNMEGTHSLVIVPGQTRKLDWMYKWKALMDLNHISPPTRFIHFAEVMDAQVVYAINPIEFFNYLLYFRRNPLHSSIGAAEPSARTAAEEAEERASWDADAFRDYSDAKGDPLGTVSYEWVDGRADGDGAAQHSGKTYVAEDGSVA